MGELPFDLEPFTKRDMPNDSKIHTEFTDECRARLWAFFDQNATHSEIKTAAGKLAQEYVREFKGFDSEWATSNEKLEWFLKNEEHELVLEYVEYLYNLMWYDDNHHTDLLLTYDARLRRIFRETRVLIRLSPEHEELVDMCEEDDEKSRKQQLQNKPITFQIVGSEALLSADNDIQKITNDFAWQQAVEPYNEAWEKYQNDFIDLALFKKLNLALENVIYKICKEDNDWADDGDGLGSCLDELQERGFFEPNNELYGEWSKIAEGLQVALRKPSADKHRHEEIDEEYAVMVLHQTAAFLTFLIRRYESEYN